MQKSQFEKSALTPKQQRRRKLLHSLLGAALGALAGIALLSTIMPANIVALAPVLGSVIGAVAGYKSDIIFQNVRNAMRLNKQKKQPREQQRQSQKEKGKTEEKLPLKERLAEKEAPRELVQESQKPEVKQVGQSLATVNAQAKSLSPATADLPNKSGKTITVNGVELPDYVHSQISRRYDPVTLTKDQLERAIRSAFVDGRVFDDDNAKHGFDDELHVCTTERPVGQAETFVEALEDEKLMNKHKKQQLDQ